MVKVIGQAALGRKRRTRDVEPVPTLIRSCSEPESPFRWQISIRTAIKLRTVEGRWRRKIYHLKILPSRVRWRRISPMLDVRTAIRPISGAKGG